MVRSRGLGRLMNPRRIPVTLGTAVGVAFVAALIGVAPPARADTEPDPFEDLFGDSGINTWTPAADASLGTSTATSLDALIDSMDSSGISPPFLNIIGQLDPGAYTDQPGGYLPADWLGDFANTLDFSLYASGLAPVVDPAILDTFQWTEGLILSPLLLLAGFFG